MAKGRKMLDTRDHEIGQNRVAIMPVTGDAEMDQGEIEVIERPQPKAKLDLLCFMDEMVVVMVHTSPEKFAEPLVQVWNDGRHQLFPRGQEVTCKRKFVEVLARAKPTNFRNEEYIDADGNKSVRWPSSQSLKYPFTVIRDDNPNGAAWLKALLAEGE